MENREEKILDISFLIFDRLERSITGNDGSKFNSKDIFKRRWSNKDNIVDGELGELFFLSELYGRSKNNDVNVAMMTRLGKLESACKVRKTNNYTFYFGRMGLCYFYINLFRITGDDEYLQRAMKITREHIHPNSFHFSLLNSCSLYDGGSGILLVLLHLFVETREDWILHIIGLYAAKLVHSANMGPCGVSWGGLAYGPGRHVGLAYGGSGIALSLLELGRVLENDTFYTLAKYALMYEHDYKLARGKPDRFQYDCHGSRLVALYVDQLLQEECFSVNRNKWIDEAKNLTGRWDMPISNGISTGWSGYGIFFMEAYVITKHQGYLEAANSVADRLIANRTNNLLHEDDSFMCGNCGIGYFLLRTASGDHARDPSVVFPRIPDTAIGIKDKIKVGILGMNRLELLKKLLEKEFTYSYSLLNKYFFSEIEKSPFTADHMVVSEIIDWFYSCIQLEEPVDDHSDLKYLFNKDVFLINMRLSHIDSNPPDEADSVQKTEHLLSMDTQDFMNIPFMWAKSIRVFDCDEAIDFFREMTASEFAVFFASYGSRSFVCRISSLGSIEIRQLSLEKIIFDKFSSARKAEIVYDEMLRFIFSQRAESLDLVKKSYGVVDDEQLKEIIYDRVYNAVKLYLVDGYLDFIIPENTLRFYERTSSYY